MKNKIKRNSFVEGTLIAYFAIILSKLIGAFYSIPFYAIIGERGGVVYSCAYNIYNLFLTISTSGIPTAISIIISEYNSLKMFAAKEKAHKTARNTVFIISLFAFILLFATAPFIGRFFLGSDAQGDDVTAAIRTVSFCLLVVPFLSIRRGYLQGHAYIAPSSTSQVIEQFVRVFVILVGSYVAVIVLNQSQTVGVCVALTGALAGALAAYFYLSFKMKANRSAFLPAEGDVVNDTQVSTKETLKKIARICIPLIIVAISSNIYDITDMKLVITGLSSLDEYSAADSEVIASIIATWGPKICVLITSLAMGLTSSMIPHMVDSFVKNDRQGVNRKFNQAVGTILVLAVPMAVGMCLLSHPLYYVFYGESRFGPTLMRLLPFLRIFESVSMVASMCLQSIGLAKVVCFTSVGGLLINAACDVPFIYLCHFLGLPAYWGAGFSSMLGYTVSIAAVFILLKKKYGLKYFSLVKTVAKVILGLIPMIAVVLLCLHFIPMSGGRLVQFVLMALIALLGAVCYGFVTYKTGAVTDVFGENFLNKILVKLHLKKAR